MKEKDWRGAAYASEQALERQRSARELERIALQRRGAMGHAAQEREIAALEREFEALQAQRKPAAAEKAPDSAPIRVVVSTAADEEFREQIRALQQQYKAAAEQGAKRFEEFSAGLRQVTETVAKRPKPWHIRAPSGKVYEVLSDDQPKADDGGGTSREGDS